MIESRAHVVPEDLSGSRFDSAAATLFGDISRKKIKAIIDAGGAYLNKKRVKVAKSEVRKGDRIELFWESGAQKNAEPGEAPSRTAIRSFGHTFSAADILFESADYMVILKPAGVPSQATLTSSTDTILHAVHALDSEKYPLKDLFLVHRLDKETSGVMLIARNKQTREFLEASFRDRKIKKVYEALCFHVPKESKGIINFPVAKDPARPNAYYALMGKGGRLPPDAKSAVTDFVVLASFAKADASYVRVYPQTGRTHQIRVHMQALNCPLLGDKTYSQNIVGHSLAQIALRLMLHAKEISFKDPLGNVVKYEAPLPEDFRNCLQEIESREGKA
jgi:23S rRNA pseudouridine1911/1915/1917 synthase